ncbi:MAG TPA: DUF47 family protein [Longimicrobiaceae bacterium]|nr:DUF47 family protein [Longimicrobiaceae bacterium]
MRLRVQGQRFFDTFSRLAHILTECTRLQARLLAEPDRRGELVAEVSALEQEAARLREEVVADMGEVASPPLDRTDVHLLASRLYGMVELLDNHARRVHALDPVPAPEPLANLGNVLVRAARRLEITVALLKERDKRESQGLEMERLEEEGDAISDAAVEALFTGSPDPMAALIWKDLYDALTDAIHRCRDTEGVVRRVVR